MNPNRLRDTGIGTLVGAGLGAIASFAVIGTSRNFFVDTGTPAELVLPHSLSVGPGRGLDAVEAWAGAGGLSSAERKSRRRWMFSRGGVLPWKLRGHDHFYERFQQLWPLRQ